MRLPDLETPVGVTQEESLLRPGEAAEFLRVAVATLKDWRGRLHGIGPSFIRVGGRVRYSLRDLRRYVKSRTVSALGKKKRR